MKQKQETGTEPLTGYYTTTNPTQEIYQQSHVPFPIHTQQDISMQPMLVSPFNASQEFQPYVAMQAGAIPQSNVEEQSQMYAATQPSSVPQFNMEEQSQRHLQGLVPQIPDSVGSQMNSELEMPLQPQLFSQDYATAHGSTSQLQFYDYQLGQNSTFTAPLQPNNSLTSSRISAHPGLPRPNHPATNDTSYAAALSIRDHNVRFVPGASLCGAQWQAHNNTFQGEGNESASDAALSMRIHNMAFQPGVPVFDAEAQFQRLSDTMGEEIDEMMNQMAIENLNYGQQYSQ